METPDLNIEDFMEVVYKCKFCPYTCTQSPDMGLHVKEKHLKSLSNPSPDLTKHSPDNFVGSSLPRASSATMANASTLDNYGDGMIEAPTKSHATSSVVSNREKGGLAMQVTDELLSFATEGSQAYMDKSLVTAVPVSQSSTGGLSNPSTPDLTELINMVKPVAESQRQPSVHMALSNQAQLPLENVVQLPPTISTEPYPAASADFMSSLSSTQPVAVMAIQLPSLNPESTTTPQYIVETSANPEALSMNNATETKEFLLCGLCKLAFTSMEDCQSHMQMEHREMMQGVGVSIGVQAGGGKRGRKRKGESSQSSQGSQSQAKAKDETYLDPDDVEWLPSVPEGNRTTHRDGRTRRKVIPPKALKEDYVLGMKAVKRKHRKSVTALGHNLLCPMMNCKARFKTKEGLDIHLSSHNLDDSAFTCPECHASHDFWKHLRFHLWKVHLIDVDLLTCETCSYKTDTVRKMNIHKEIHSKDKPYKCDVCGKGFRQASQQRNHMNIHRAQSDQDSVQLYLSKKCDICDRVFANSKCLANHKEAVHSKVKPYECQFCSHTTSRKAMMQLHMRTHTGEKPFKCDVCPYTTGDHNSMRRHKMRHTGEKQYRCILCMYTCIQSISLKQHMKNKHPGVNSGIFQCTRCPFRSINQNHYDSHVMDHKKGLIPDSVILHQASSPKSKRASSKSHGAKQRGLQNRVDPAYIKHPQFHTVLPGDESGTIAALEGISVDIGDRETQSDVFNMQVTMLPGGDTQVSADDMTKLSENDNLRALGVAPLQLIYATLSTISEQADLTCVEEGRSSLLTIELLGGVQTAVLSSVQEGSIMHSITYHFPAAGPVPGSNNNNNNKDNLEEDESDHLKGRAGNEAVSTVKASASSVTGRAAEIKKDLKVGPVKGAVVNEKKVAVREKANLTSAGCSNQENLHVISTGPFVSTEMLVGDPGVEVEGRKANGDVTGGKSSVASKIQSQQLQQQQLPQQAMFLVDEQKNSWKKTGNVIDMDISQVDSVDGSILLGGKQVVMVNSDGELLSAASKVETGPNSVVGSIPSVMVSEQSVAVINTGSGTVQLVSSFLEPNPQDAQNGQTFLAVDTNCMPSA